MRLASLVAALLAAAAPVLAQGQSNEPLKLGYLVDASGPMQGIFKTGLDGFKLYIDAVNESGGVNGRKIDLMVRDVQIDPARSAASAQELADQGALAILGLSLTSTHMPVYNAMQKANVPVVTGFPANVGVVLPPNAREGVYGVGLDSNFSPTPTSSRTLIRSFGSSEKRMPVPAEARTSRRLKVPSVGATAPIPAKPTTPNRHHTGSRYSACAVSIWLFR